ncbi:MAG: class I SAM-dependent methyltransferase [Zoogloeaceae bacterium]|nr:class I SAM-dependent methyltransferase [Zoogloeaceae bacterium]
MNAKKTALRPCPICDRNRAEILFAMRCAVLEGGVSDVVSCIDCGMVYADTPGTQADYDRLYTDFSIYESQDALGSGDEPEDARRIEETAGWLEARIGARNARIVDIGCARGGLLKALSRRGFSSLAGIDPSARCVEHVRAAGFSAWQGHLSHLPGCGQDFDFIILSHVLEHVVDTHGALSGLRELLAPGGKLYIEVPDASRYHHHQETRPPFGFFYPEHINHFDLPHLTRLCALHGLGVSDVCRKPVIPAFGILVSPHFPCALGEEEENHLKNIIAAYHLESQRRSSSRIEFLLDQIGGRPVALWGVGEQAFRMLADPAWKKVDIVAVVDRDPAMQGKIYADCIIRSPEEGLRRLPGNTLVVILPFFHAEEIKRELTRLHTGLSSLVLNPPSMEQNLT